MGWKLKDLNSSRVIELRAGDIMGRTEGPHTFPESNKMSRAHCQFLLGDGHIIMFGDKTFMLKGDGETVALPGTNEARGQFTAPVADHAFSFDGSTSELFMLLIKNVLLTILTLGIYIPYARTNMRKYIWKSSHLAGHPFMFRGNPRSLMKSYFILFVLFILFSGANQLVAAFIVKGNVPLSIAHGLVNYAILGLFFIAARYGAYAYMVNNTTYRSVNFKVRKEGRKEYLSKSLITIAFTFLTLGLYYPFMDSKLDRVRWKHTFYGTLPFKYKVEDWDYAKLWYKGYFLTLFTLGLYYPWMAISLHKYRMAQLHFNGGKFNTTATGGSYFMVCLKSVLLIIVTLGLAAPFVFNLNLSYFLDNLSIKGSLDFDQIVAGSQLPSKNGLADSVADVFDLDVDIGMT